MTLWCRPSPAPKGKAMANEMENLLIGFISQRYVTVMIQTYIRYTQEDRQEDELGDIRN